MALLLAQFKIELSCFRDLVVGNCCDFSALLLQDTDQVLLELHLSAVQEACCRCRVGLINPTCEHHLPLGRLTKSGLLLSTYRREHRLGHEATR